MLPTYKGEKNEIRQILKSVKNNKAKNCCKGSLRRWKSFCKCEDDIIEIRYASKMLKAKITSIKEQVRKEDAKEMYEILSGEEDS